jgi:hypothetical protein
VTVVLITPLTQANSWRTIQATRRQINIYVWTESIKNISHISPQQLERTIYRLQILPANININKVSNCQPNEKHIIAHRITCIQEIKSFYCAQQESAELTWQFHVECQQFHWFSSESTKFRRTIWNPKNGWAFLDSSSYQKPHIIWVIAKNKHCSISLKSTMLPQSLQFSLKTIRFCLTGDGYRFLAFRNPIRTTKAPIYKLCLFELFNVR